MNTFKYSSPSTQPSSITLDTLVQEASQKTSHPYLKRKVTHRKTFAKLQNQESLLRWTKDQLRSESLRIYTNSHPRLHVSSLNTKGTNTDNATQIEQSYLTSLIFSLKKRSHRWVELELPPSHRSAHRLPRICMEFQWSKDLHKRWLTQEWCLQRMPSIASTYPTYSLSLKGVSVPIYSHIVPKV